VNTAKIQLSETELQLVTNSEVILTKNRIIKKVYDMLGLVAGEMRIIARDHQSVLPAELLLAAPKIARGENYLGLPYVMLDYPRLFEKDDVFAIRMMFWWGNFFSATLHLKGKHKSKYQENLVNQFAFFCEKHYYVCVSSEEWNHHFGANNYQPVARFTPEEFENRIREKDFIKLSLQHPLSAWENAAEFFLLSFKQMLFISG